MASIITKFRSTPAERKDVENAIAETEDMRAVADPTEDEEEEEE